MLQRKYGNPLSFGSVDRLNLGNSILENSSAWLHIHTNDLIFVQSLTQNPKRKIWDTVTWSSSSLPSNMEKNNSLQAITFPCLSSRWMPLWVSFPSGSTYGGLLYSWRIALPFPCYTSQINDSGSLSFLFLCHFLYDALLWPFFFISSVLLPSLRLSLHSGCLPAECSVVVCQILVSCCTLMPSTAHLRGARLGEQEHRHALVNSHRSHIVVQHIQTLGEHCNTLLRYGKFY